MKWCCERAVSTDARSMAGHGILMRSIWRKMTRYRCCMPHWITAAVSMCRDMKKIELHPATRFIGTMNYGYAGTKELNEALVSRFLVIDMPSQTEETLDYVLGKMFPGLKEHAKKQWIGLFLDLQLKAEHGEISTKSLDLRGMTGAIATIKRGLKPAFAAKIGIVNKCFDVFEKELVSDVVMTRIPDTWTPADVF